MPFQIRKADDGVLVELTGAGEIALLREVKGEITVTVGHGDAQFVGGARGTGTAQ